MQVSRQQRRAVERSKEKRRVADVKARNRARRRIALISAWRKRHAFTGWQKFWLVVEGLFFVLGGPLVWIFYNPEWWLERAKQKRRVHSMREDERVMRSVVSPEAE
jgi:hypothetical protein